MKFTYYGHACFAVQGGGNTLLFDPFISPNPLAKKIDVSKIAADFILVSHGHGDHVADVVEIANRTGAKVVAPFEVGSWFEAKGQKNNVDVKARKQEVVERLQAVAWAKAVGDRTALETELRGLLFMDDDKNSPLYQFSISQLKQLPARKAPGL